VRRSKLLLGALAAGVACASGAAQAAHVGVFIGGAAPGYYVPAPYYYQPLPPPPPPPQYIERGPDGQPVPAPGPDEEAPLYPQDGYAPYQQGGAPPYPQDGSAPSAPGSAPQYPPGATAPAPQGSPPPPAPQAADPRAGGSSTWYFCDASNTYYPYVKDCPSGWRPVPAQPAGQQQPQ